MAWIDVLSLADLKAKGKAVVRHDGRQILLVVDGAEIYACANRCPHEGYPLSEGFLTSGCVLTCNWHNWKFNLASGATLVGGDRLTLYPVRVQAARVWLDATPPDPALRRDEILAGLSRALEDNDQPRLVRETARLSRLGAEPTLAIRHAVAFAADRLEFGTTHAIAGAPDWLCLADNEALSLDKKLACLGEILGHIADDGAAGQRFAFPSGNLAWSEAAFLKAIEREDEAQAAALARGALCAGLTIDDLLPTLVTAALAHYADFGHSLIYAVKTAELARRLGPEADAPLLLMLTRSLIYATREDLLPEFGAYSAYLREWGQARQPCPPLVAASLLLGSSPKAAMGAVAAWGASHPPERIFAVLVEAVAWQLLHVDENILTRTDGKVADNVGWFDFSHALTFAEASQTAVRLRPELWPAAVLQIACFIGRNSAYADVEFHAEAYAVADAESFFADSFNALFDHGRDRFIVSVHLLKTLRAGEALSQALPYCAPLLAAGLNRFLHARIKGRHVLRTARQMLALVDEE
jgi:nitrite reductase/ring-hydroxylating ferredoxin subunit